MKLRFGIVAVLMLLASNAHANALEQLRSFLTQTKSARGEFTQEVNQSQNSARKPQQSSGTFSFQRPGKFRWNYSKPYEQLIVGDGEKLFLYDKDLNQVTVKKLSAALPSSPASILFGSNDFEREFFVADGGARDGLAWVIATPRNKDSTFERIEIGFRDGMPNAMPEVIRMRDSFGQTTALRFAKLERNAAITADNFRFTPPKGADVLEE